jgi:uncharacterized protein
MSVGETDLQRLLSGLSPELSERPHAIRTQPANASVPADAIMLFREAEGMTVIVPVAEHDADEALWAQITLRIHSSLEAVGMMAAIATTLTAHDIPCNAVSAYYHDHIFVPWARRNNAIDVLSELAQGVPA